jgi:hypothetical protein
MNGQAIPTAKFRLGRILTTPHALEVIENDDIWAAVSRHKAGDWGEVSAEDRGANDLSLVEGTRLLSVYRSAKGLKFWVITEADRSATTVLMPEDY